MNNSMSQYSVSQRVQDMDGCKCTVRYVGPVAASKNQSEIWCGVEWDDKKRGKHDGSCVDSQGVFHRYFECEMGAGSFVKPAKLAPALSFFDALKARYVEMEAEKIATEDNILPDCFVQTAGGHQKSIQFVGEMKIRKWQQIDVVSKTVMRSLGITHIGDGTGVKMSHIDDVDLQDNLLWQWDEVRSLCRQVTGLRSLQLHGNKMQPFVPSVCREWPMDCFQNIRVLALNACGITSWLQVCLLSKYATNVEELYLTSNDLSDLQRYCGDDVDAAPVSVFSGLAVKDASSAGAGVGGEDSEVSPVLAQLPQLTVLDISHCKISSWAQVQFLLRGPADCSSATPALTDLLLDANPLPSIAPCAGAGASSFVFPAVQRLSASASNLASWTDIDALASYPQLKALRVTHVPLFAGKGVSEIRPLVVGRIAQLEFFNGSPVTSRERGDSEKSYLRRIKREAILMVEERKAAAAAAEDGAAAVLSEEEMTVAVNAELEAKHPRFAVLNREYGRDLLPMADGMQRGNTTLGEDLVKITFNSLILTGPDCEPIVKKLPSSVQVDKLKQIVKALFRLDTPVHLISLSLRAYNDKENPPLLLDDDSCTLAYFGVSSDGGDVYINEMKAKK